MSHVALKWKKYLLPMSVAFAVTYNLPKYFEMKIETADNITTIVPTGENNSIPDGIQLHES